MRFRVDIRRREGLSDPEGVTTRRALHDLGYESVEEVHFGRTVYVDIDVDDAEAGGADVAAMCERLLANPVIEDYVIEVVE